jgi:hypothetical protein
MQSQMDRLGDDQFDILQSDWRNLDTTPRPTAPNGWTRTFGTFNVLPVVISAGPDKQFDLMLRSSGLSAAGTDWNYGDPINYTIQTWPEGSGTNPTQPVPTYGAVRRSDTGYGNPHFYIDPYVAIPTAAGNSIINVNYATEPNPFTVNFSSGLPGAYYDANNDIIDDSVDNVYSLGARP